jgi:hypothetical protein
VLWTWAKIA